MIRNKIRKYMNQERFMPKNIPSLKPKELIKILEKGDVHFIEKEKAIIVYILVNYLRSRKR